MNHVVLTGRLGRDAELKFVGSKNTALATWGLAVTEGYGDKEKTHWFDCQMWGERAEKLQPHLEKGNLIGVSGFLRQNTWETTDGQKRSKVEVVVQNVEFLSSKKGGGQKTQDNEPDDVPF